MADFKSETSMSNCFSSHVPIIPLEPLGNTLNQIEKLRVPKKRMLYDSNDKVNDYLLISDGNLLKTRYKLTIVFMVTFKTLTNHI